jgi:hypothetical protein
MTLLLALLLAQAAEHPCMEDAKRLCPGVQSGQGRIAACLKEHQAEMSPACKARIAEFREGAQACQADAQKLCPGTKPGKERSACMREPTCRCARQHLGPRTGELGNGNSETRYALSIQL